MLMAAQAVTPERLAVATLVRTNREALDGWKSIACPQCRAQIGKSCRTPDGTPLVSQVHLARRRAFWEREEANR
jgi:hypothetical protein